MCFGGDAINTVAAAMARSVTHDPNAWLRLFRFIRLSILFLTDEGMYMRNIKTQVAPRVDLHTHTHTHTLASVISLKVPYQHWPSWGLQAAIQRLFIIF